MIEGVDAAQHQHPDQCDWIEAAAAGLAFAWFKGSEGRDDGAPYVDPAFGDHLENARRTRVVPGMYHFARPDNRFRESDDGFANGVAEGEFASRTAIEHNAIRGCLPIALDLEVYTDKGEVTTEQRDDYVRGFIDTVERLTGRLPVVYTGPVFWGYQHSLALADELRVGDLLLWLVQYSPAVDPPKTIEGWPWSFWQWSGGDDYVYAEPWPGLPSPIDRNRYRGSAPELASLVG